MPPKPKFTREQIIAAALDIARDSGIESITAQEVGKRLGTSTRPMFTYFDTVEELREAATEAARELYNGYAERGLSLMPPFKGFAMEYIRFAREEPSLFRLLFMRKAKAGDLEDFLNGEGHFERVVEAVEHTFHLSHEDAAWLYRNMWLYAHGAATTCATEVIEFSDDEISERLGVICRGLLMSLHAPKDERVGIIPGADVTMPGSIESYTAVRGKDG